MRQLGVEPRKPKQQIYSLPKVADTYTCPKIKHLGIEPSKQLSKCTLRIIATNKRSVCNLIQFTLYLIKQLEQDSNLHFVGFHLR